LELRLDDFCQRISKPCDVLQAERDRNAGTTRVIHTDAELDQILVGIQRSPIVLDVNRDPRRCLWNKLESTRLHIATIPVGLDGFEKRAVCRTTSDPAAVAKGLDAALCPPRGTGGVVALLSASRACVGPDRRADADAVAGRTPAVATDGVGSSWVALRRRTLRRAVVFGVLPSAPTRLTRVVGHGRIGTGDRKEERLWPG
jgi:hypothetical protein